MTNLILILALSLLLSIVSCREQSGEGTPRQQDVDALHILHDQYRQYWLKNDSLAVVNLFSEDSEILPPNNKGKTIRGRKAIGQYWFSPAETVFVITKFEYLNDSLTIDRQFAFWQGQSEVEWDVVSRGRILSSGSSESDFITVCKKVQNKWMILKQMWNNKPKN